MKQIIFINRYFWPDNSATSQILTDLCKNLDIEGLNVHVITSRALYSDSKVTLNKEDLLQDIKIHRTWTSKFGRGNLLGRFIDYISFYVTSSLYCLRLAKKGDIVVAKTDPPIISVFIALCGKFRKFTLVNWLQDVFPEVARELDVKLFKIPVIFSAVKYLRNWSLKQASKNVVLGELMADRIKDETDQAEKIKIIPNWNVNRSVTKYLPSENSLTTDWGLENQFVIGYSGNLGRAHDYSTILNCAEELKGFSDIKFLFIGGGVGMEALRSEVDKRGLKNFLFKPYQPIDRLSESLSVASVHLVTLEENLEGLIVPSKVYGILAVGKPIIFIGSKRGEFSRLLNDYDCGSVVEVGSVSEMKKEIIELKDCRDALAKKSAQASKCFEERYKYGNSISIWTDMIQGMVKKSSQLPVVDEVSMS